MGIKVGDFFSLKNMCILSVLVSVCIASGLFTPIRAYYNSEYYMVVIGIVIYVFAWKCVSSITVKWALYAVSLYALANNLSQIVHLYYYDPYGCVPHLIFLIICIWGIRKTNSYVEKIDLVAFGVIALLPYIIGCLLVYMDDFSASAWIAMRGSVLLLPLVVYALFFAISLKNTSNDELKKSIALSLVGSVALFVLFFVTIIIGLRTSIGLDASDLVSMSDWYDFDWYGYDWLDCGIVIMGSFIAGSLMSAYFIHLLIKTKYALRSVCIPSIIGMVSVGVLAAFTVGNTYSPDSIIRGLGNMSLGYIIASFGIYKLYKKL